MMRINLMKGRHGIEEEIEREHARYEALARRLERLPCVGSYLGTYVRKFAGWKGYEGEVYRDMRQRHKKDRKLLGE